MNNQDVLDYSDLENMLQNGSVGDVTGAVAVITGDLPLLLKVVKGEPVEDLERYFAVGAPAKGKLVKKMIPVKKADIRYMYFLSAQNATIANNPVKGSQTLISSMKAVFDHVCMVRPMPLISAQGVFDGTSKFIATIDSSKILSETNQEFDQALVPLVKLTIGGKLTTQSTVKTYKVSVEGTPIGTSHAYNKLWKSGTFKVTVDNLQRSAEIFIIPWSVQDNLAVPQLLGITPADQNVVTLPCAKNASLIVTIDGCTSENDVQVDIPSASSDEFIAVQEVATQRIVKVQK